MPNITLNVSGSDKENVEAVVVGGVRWGKNGTAALNAAQMVNAGQQAFQVFYTTGSSGGTVNVPMQAGSISIPANGPA